MKLYGNDGRVKFQKTVKRRELIKARDLSDKKWLTTTYLAHCKTQMNRTVHLEPSNHIMWLTLFL